MNLLDVNICNVITLAALASAREYIKMVETQTEKAYRELKQTAIDAFRKFPDPDEADFDILVNAVDRDFDNDYRPILRYTGVIYLYMFFETYVSRHVIDLQKIRKGNPKILTQIQKTENLGFVDAAYCYFTDEIRVTFLTPDQWDRIREISNLRNCIVHYAGVVSAYRHGIEIEKLEKRIWKGASVGIEIYRTSQGEIVDHPLIIEHRFLEYTLDLLEHFFESLVKTIDPIYKAVEDIPVQA